MELVETPDHHEMSRKIMMSRGLLATFLSEHSHTKWWYYHSRHICRIPWLYKKRPASHLSSCNIYGEKDIEIPILVIKSGDFDLLSIKF